MSSEESGWAARQQARTKHQCHGETAMDAKGLRGTFELFKPPTGTLRPFVLPEPSQEDEDRAVISRWERGGVLFR